MCTPIILVLAWGAQDGEGDSSCLLYSQTGLLNEPQVPEWCQSPGFLLFIVCLFVCLFIYLLICIHACAHTYRHTLHAGHRTTCENLFSLCSMWVLGIRELGHQARRQVTFPFEQASSSCTYSQKWCRSLCWSKQSRYSVLYKNIIIVCVYMDICALGILDS